MQYTLNKCYYIIVVSQGKAGGFFSKYEENFIGICSLLVYSGFMV